MCSVFFLTCYLVSLNETHYARLFVVFVKCLVQSCLVKNLEVIPMTWPICRNLEVGYPVTLTRLKKQFNNRGVGYLKKYRWSPTPSGSTTRGSCLNLYTQYTTVTFIEVWWVYLTTLNWWHLTSVFGFSREDWKGHETLLQFPRVAVPYLGYLVIFLWFLILSLEKS